MTGRLSNKVALITGAATGIGEAVAHKFAREGADLMIMGFNGDPIDSVADAIREQYGSKVETFTGDAAEEADAQAIVTKTVERFGRLDVLCNIAGVFILTAEIQDYDVEAFDRTFRNNCRSTFLMTKFAIPALRQTRGVVISTGSEGGEVGVAQAAPYGASKGFVHALMRGVAYEQGKYGVRANCVCPGPTATAWVFADMGPFGKEAERRTVENAILGRHGTPEEMANIYAFLASDEASYVTGALWYADGGTTIANGSPGAEVGQEFRAPPAAKLRLSHGLDGLKNKSFASKVS